MNWLQVALRLFEDAGGDARVAIQSQAELLRQWLGAVRVIPRSGMAAGG